MNLTNEQLLDLARNLLDVARPLRSALDSLSRQPVTYTAKQVAVMRSHGRFANSPTFSDQEIADSLNRRAVNRHQKDRARLARYAQEILAVVEGAEVQS